MAIVAEVVRSGFVESRHSGSVVALRPDGSVAFAVGDVDVPIYPRSSNKPMQAAGVLRLGIAEKYGLDDTHVAVATASHSGEPMHIEVVRDLLSRAGVAESELATPPDFPIDVEAMHAVVQHGGGKTRIQHNCSGKHASFLAACAAQGWPTDGYRDPAHPLQVHLRAVVEELSGEPVAGIGVDGCGAPIFALTLVGLARAFGRIATAAEGSPEALVAQAIRNQPLLMGGTGRDVSRLVAAVPGIIAKDGAEGVYAAALPDGTAVALKIDDGTQRARPPVMVAALRALGVTGDEGELDAIASPEVLGGGVRVGEVRAVPGLFG
ncbi:MAG TPA: asparaginase [Frankiaceae bacterium]|nr:asparaginase [Frankiaceae bacterium]